MWMWKSRYCYAAVPPSPLSLGLCLHFSGPEIRWTLYKGIGYSQFLPSLTFRWPNCSFPGLLVLNVSNLCPVVRPFYFTPLREEQWRNRASWKIYVWSSTNDPVILLWGFLCWNPLKYRPGLICHVLHNESCRTSTDPNNRSTFNRLPVGPAHVPSQSRLHRSSGGLGMGMGSGPLVLKPLECSSYLFALHCELQALTLQLDRAEPLHTL